MGKFFQRIVFCKRRKNQMKILEFKNTITAFMGLKEFRHRRQSHWTGSMANRKISKLKHRKSRNEKYRKKHEICETQ